MLLFLKHRGIKFESQKRFSFIGRKSLDFYLPDYKVAIECQGVQHYKDCGMFGGKEQHKRDIAKEKECSQNGVKIVYYTDYRNKNIVPKRFRKDTFYNLTLMIEYIEKHGI